MGDLDEYLNSAAAAAASSSSSSSSTSTTSTSFSSSTSASTTDSDYITEIDSRESRETLDQKNYCPKCDPSCRNLLCKNLAECLSSLTEPPRGRDLLLTKGIECFEEICQCTRNCLNNEYLKDEFVRSILASIALFTIGVKLTSELAAWNIRI